MSALGRVVRSGVGRRRVQTAVVGLVAGAAVTASVLAIGLVVASRAPFDTAFAKQRGAHLTMQVNGGKVTEERVAATAHATGVLAAAGPFRATTVVFEATNQPGPGGGTGVGRPLHLPALTVVGRADNGGDVDRVTLIEGAWAAGPGEIVVDAGRGQPLRLGTKLRATDAPGSPTYTVVGVARSVSRTAGAWVRPADLDALLRTGTTADYQMLYRFANADTAEGISAARAAVTAGLPAGAVAVTRGWLDTRRDAIARAQIFVPFLLAFAAIGLFMSILIVGNVVAGAVGAALRRIGILKAVGFTPTQVVRAYVGQALVPAAVGAAAGLVAGNFLAGQVLQQVQQVYGTAGAAIDWWIDAAVAAAVLGVVALTAWVSALRAGRLRTVDALTIGRAPGSGRGRWAARLTARLPIPRPVGLGLAHPFARPARALAILLAVAFGAAAATFAVGLGEAMIGIQHATEHDTAAVEVEPMPTGPGSQSENGPDPDAVLAAINAQPGTASAYGLLQGFGTVPGVTDAVQTDRFVGDPRWDSYTMVSGRWYAAPGEVVVSGPFLRATGASLGDTVTVDVDGTSVRATIVGQVFAGNPEVFADAATLPAGKDDHGFQYEVALAAGTDVDSYAQSLTTALTGFGLRAQPNSAELQSMVLVIDALVTMLTALLVAVAALGVLNMVILDLRDRVRDLGVQKAVGMTPRQTVAMVVASVTGIGLVGGLAGVPVGTSLLGAVVPAMGSGAGLTVPASLIDVYHASTLAPLAFGGLVIAVLGAVVPAGWAVRLRTATALRTE